MAGLALTLAQSAPAQFAKRTPVSKGPRALGLVELAPNGKAHLVPVAIMVDGEFYDASAYKASPVPMALESHTVYEAFRAGVSQGLFTVTGALQKPGSWIGEGTWLAAGRIAASKGRLAETKPRDADEPKPPVLRHADSEPSKGGASSGSPATPASTASAPSPAPAPTTNEDPDRPVLHRPQPEPEAQTAPAPTAEDDPDRPVLHKAQAAPEAQTPPSSAVPPASASAPAPAPEEDPDQPTLRRGKPAAKPAEKPASQTAAVSKAPAAASPAPAGGKAASATVIQTIAAISDAGGPEAHPYNYALKPGEEDEFRKKMLVLAAEEIRARSEQLASEMVGAAPAHAAARSRKTGRPTPPPQPDFEDVKLQIFDLSNSNEPVLVLTAKAHLPHRRNDTTPDLQYVVALVARQDIYGDLHKAFSNVTDTQHLDVLPVMEFIDAVDADGDGRGELLFRETSDAGSAFVIYRVIGNQLWALFQGTPQ